MNELQQRTISVTAAVSQGRGEQLAAKVAEAILQVAQFCGMTMSAEDCALAAASYVEAVAEDFPQLDTNEIRTIFRNGMREKYGDIESYTRISAKLLYRWTSRYMSEGATHAAQRQAQATAARTQAYIDREERKRQARLNEYRNSNQKALEDGEDAADEPADRSVERALCHIFKN